MNGNYGQRATFGGAAYAPFNAQGQEDPSHFK